MLNENAKKWVAALRSKEFQQTYNRLRTEAGYCCLGVGCEVYKRETGLGEWVASDGEPGTQTFDKHITGLPVEVVGWLGLCSSNGQYKVESRVTGPTTTSLILDNDTFQKSFKEIADIVESEPEGLFCQTDTVQSS